VRSYFEKPHHKKKEKRLAQGVSPELNPSTTKKEDAN
jgi:hemerythrin-like domain-containing protein